MHRIKINLAQNSAFSFSVSVDFALNRVKYLIDDLEQDFNVLQNRDLELVTIRHYTPEAIDEHTSEMKVLLEQKCPQTIQLLGSR